MATCQVNYLVTLTFNFNVSSNFEKVSHQDSTKIHTDTLFSHVLAYFSSSGNEQSKPLILTMEIEKTRSFDIQCPEFVYLCSSDK